MSIQQILAPNELQIFANKINGVQGNTITGSNSVGQVLTITSTDPKTVAFEDASGTTPPTLGQPNGYVLAIQDNVTGVLEWKQDAQGSIPDPLVLSGANNSNKFQVRNSASEPIMTVDTLNSQVQLGADKTIIEGNDDTIKIAVYNSGDSIPEFKVDTVNHQVSIGGTASVEKLNVKSTSGNTLFGVNNATGEILVSDNTGDTTFVIDPIVAQTFLESSTASDVRHIISNVSAGPNAVEIVAKNDGTVEINPTNELNISGKVAVVGLDSDTKFAVISNASSFNTLNVDTLNEIVSVPGSLLVIDQVLGSPYFNADHANKNVSILGTNNANKFAVKDSADKIMLAVNTSSKRVVSQGDLWMLDPVSVSRYVDIDAGTQTFTMSDQNHQDKFLVKLLNGNRCFKVDTQFNRVVLGPGGGVEQVLDIDDASYTISHPTAASELKLLSTVQASELKMVASNSAITDVNKIISNKPLDISASDVTLIASNIGDVYNFEQTNSNHSASISNYSAPVALPVGISTTLLQRMDVDQAGLGTANYIGYSASNGPSAMYNVVSNAQCGVFFNAPNCSVSSLGNFNLGSYAPTSTTFIESQGGELALRTQQGDGSEISMLNAGITMNADNGVYMNFRNNISEAETYFNVLGGVLPSATTPLVQVAWTQIVTTGATFVNGTLNNFTSSLGTFTYTGTIPRRFRITLNICGEMSNNDQMTALVMLDNALAVIPSTYGCFFSADTLKGGGVSYTVTRTLQPADVCRFAFRTPRATNDWTIKGYSLSVVEV